jgi:hypothetical protein
MRLEEDFRFNLQGQLSHEKTEVDVTIASRIAREFAVSFSLFLRKNYSVVQYDGWDLIPDIWRDKKTDGEYSTKQLLKIYEDGL